MSIAIRFAELDDAAAIQAVYAPFCESSVISFEMAAPTVGQMAVRIQRIGQQYPWLVCEVDGQVAGYAYGCTHRERAAYRWAVEVTIYIADQHHRRGIGRALYTSLFTLLRRQGYYKAFAGITLPNSASVGLHEAMGFWPIGVYQGIGNKYGQWLDVGWWQLDLQPGTVNPAEPLPIGTIREGDDSVAALAEGERILSSQATRQPPPPV